ncbi:aldehyde dehydrogenase family protein [Cellulosilyticum lentocellum]|uniref:3-sulfolactaldehyde dehydrogenase n=1 Tax=Cellulosilyticum lentocellum (strain ATCC 49066 / DSM 5427 / NCIMB 11756 / RHM5) TaxID=642492 RepID=F2JPQ2_CELLD|nr:aldehyde dehydrogenase family protein [Cellulosilyticum lentocellum]ADZ83712.1 Betaine-aldehyde dehydrogenase [Cellulosilyticum lentocellum DSM 5427]
MKMIIDGKQVDASNRATLNVINPANGKLVSTIPAATENDVELAVACAAKGQKIWASYPLYKRGTILSKFINLTQEPEMKYSLASLLSQETGKPITEAIAEIGNIPSLFGGFIEKAKHLYDTTIPAGIEPGTEHTLQIITREPVGTVACIIPFNFPVDLFGQKIAPALIAGNAAIVKPSTHNPLTLMKLCELLVAAGVPDGAIQVLTGDPADVPRWLVKNPGIHLISLTGSTKVGIETAGTAAKNLTPVALELGGNDAFILLEDGNVDLAVEETIFGRTYNTGQVCCASKRFLIHESRKQEYTDKLIARLKTLKVGDPADPETNVGCLISEEAAKNVETQVNLTIYEGASLLYGGERSGAFYPPTVLTNVTANMEVAKDLEIFGPVIPIIGFNTPEEAIAIANQSSFGLSSNVFTQDMQLALKVASQLQAGGVVINGCSFFRSCEMPFGGYKMSGIGNEGIACTLEEMTQIKTIVLKNIL